MNFLKKISKEEFLIGTAVFVVVYYLLSRKKETQTKSDTKAPSRMVVDDSSVKRVDYPQNIEEEFKKTVGSSYTQFVKDLDEIGLDRTIAYRQIYTESRYNPQIINCSIVSPVGAKGIAQFMPATWQQYGQGGNVCSISDSLRAYPKLMKNIMGMYPGRIDLALAGYNWGPYRQVLKDAYKNKTPFLELKSKMPKETYGYVTSILRP